MTTREKTAAIQKIMANHEDNVAAKNAAHLSAGLEDLVIEAMTNAVKDDLARIFAINSRPMRAARLRGKQ